MLMCILHIQHSNSIIICIISHYLLYYNYWSSLLPSFYFVYVDYRCSIVHPFIVDGRLFTTIVRLGLYVCEFYFLLC